MSTTLASSFGYLDTDWWREVQHCGRKKERRRLLDIIEHGGYWLFLYDDGGHDLFVRETSVRRRWTEVPRSVREELWPYVRRHRSLPRCLRPKRYDERGNPRCDENGRLLHGGAR